MTLAAEKPLIIITTWNSKRNYFCRARHNPEPRSEVDGEICGGVLVEDASDDFPQQKKLENLRRNFAGSSPPISPKTSPTSLWKSLVLIFAKKNTLTNSLFDIRNFSCDSFGADNRAHA